MIPEIGTYQQLKRAVLAELPAKKVLSYRVVSVDRRILRSFAQAGEAIRALRTQAMESGQVCIIEPEWGW
jgi:hypothetical protein